MTAFVLTEDNLACEKRRIRHLFPDAKSSHVSEALAAALGRRTHAALLEEIKKVDSDHPPVFAINEDVFRARLKALCQTELPKTLKEGLFESPLFRGYYPLIRTWYRRPHEIAYKTPRAMAWRNLMVAAINAGIEQKLFSVRKGDNRWPGADQGKGFTYRFDVYGKKGAAYVDDIGFGELKIHAAVDLVYGGELCMCLPTAGFYAGNAFGMACMDRDQGAYLQTALAFFRVREPLVQFLARCDVKTKGYGDKGKIAM